MIRFAFALLEKPGIELVVESVDSDVLDERVMDAAFIAFDRTEKGKKTKENFKSH